MQSTVACFAFGFGVTITAIPWAALEWIRTRSRWDATFFWIFVTLAALWGFAWWAS